ncbi:SusD/RagB family nutrient-binding outer membrane lipoprotein [Sphingobacterium sp. SYP-B4668]|uniref:SusD/RagB family nutrient-binding outer membrane lipoprotein n=1 Tax=Sphingobacterium sp. SYP-B4668 TaxID=2996035 RepID=UPI0022DCEB6A|nr:SusD/RagB family nutrient-binding outer membrane lipoprotein [Sphingobacterium sp. SYP-B4668]
MKIIYFSIIILTASFLTSSCQKFGYYQDNPNKPTNATPALLMSRICQTIFNNNPIDAAYATRHLTYYERPSESINYNWNRSSFGGYENLMQVQKLQDLAKDHPNYQGVAKLFRAIFFSRLTETFGDIPYREALLAEKDIRKPAYDTQEDIYEGLLKELEEANDLLQPTNGTIDGDIIYGGNILRWKKLVNAFRLRLLIHLSKKEGQSKIRIKEQFNSIISNPTHYPLMESNSDNGQIVFNTTDPSNYYPTAGHLSVATLVSLEESFVKLLKNRQDPRLFSFGDPISGMPAGQFSSYKGVDAGLSPADQQSTAAGSSLIARRYVDLRNPVNEPMIFMSYAEQEFIIAEGIHRGWAAGTINQHYRNGVVASMDFYKIDEQQADTYLSMPLVALSSGDVLIKILTQKYIAFFMNSGWEPFYEQRRTGIPILRVGPGTLNGGKVPKRWQYPLTEIQYNEEHVQQAIERQYPEGDNTNASMWLIK